MPSTNRKRFPRNVETEVLIKYKRRCALCFGIDGDASEKEGQIAHIDRNPVNIPLDNAAFLCTKHHARYDSRSKQTKGLAPDELRFYQRMLCDYLVEPEAVANSSGTFGSHGKDPKLGKRGVSLEVYNRRFPIYRATTQFVRVVLKELKPDLQDILKFASDTEEALFLFDETIADYLTYIFKRALRLRTISLIQTQVPADHRTAHLRDEEAELAVWFSGQFQEIRSRFAPFLRLA